MRVALGIVLAMILTGCGSMSVEVSVLNPATVEQELDRRLLRETLPAVLGQSELGVRQSVLDVQNDHFGFLTQLSQNYLTVARKAPRQERSFLREQAAGLQRSMTRWRSVYEEAQRQLLALRTEILTLQQALTQVRPEERMAIESRIAQALRIRNQQLAELNRLVQIEIGERLSEASQDINIREQTQDAAEAAVDTAKRSLTGGQGIVEDPYAYTVASADDTHWAHQFNTVIGRGTFGNFNMAVKMESLGDFTLKGLTFDPSDVARVAGKVTTQALLLASQIAGVPVDLASDATATGGEGLRVSSKKLADAQNTQALEEAKIQAHEEGLLALAATVLREWPSLESDTQRAGGIAAIKGAFAANKPRIKMEQGSTTPPDSDDDESDDDDGSDDDGDGTDDGTADEDDEAGGEGSGEGSDETEDETDASPPQEM